MRTRGPRLPSSPILASLAVLSALACVAPPDGDPATGSAGSPIVNGDPETGWPAVGTLTASQGGYYIGTFCTGTLIAPQWVLTAAHCVTPTQEFPVTPQMTRFFIGDDAQPVGNYEPPQEGAFYPADKFYPHPDYRASDWSVDNDVALVHLAKPVVGVDPIAVNAKALDNSWVDRSILYVGFGNSDGYEGQTAGVKLSGHMRLVSVGNHDYMSAYEGQGVCAGDSGGPGLYQDGGQWVVIGVNSTVGNDNGGDPCTGVANHMRVDVYAPWIASVTSLPPPDCRKDAAVCECADACQQADGTCNNDVCQTWDCAAIYDCMVNCADQACSQACFGRGTAEGQATIGAMLQCFQDKCGSAGSDQEFQQCAYNQCGSEINACFPQPTGNLTCEEAYGCMVECPQGSQSCLGGCWEQGTAAAQGQLQALFQCFQSQCGSVADAEFRDCAVSKCESQIVACMPPAECSLLGGDCPEGAACAPSLGTHTDCAGSAEGQPGTPCDPAREDLLPCDDGLECLPGPEGQAVCRPLCLSDDDCDGGTCESPVFEGRPEGACTLAPCVDADGDGACGKADCDDTDTLAYPGAAERCGNGRDDDCDDEVDEGCEACTDADGDGFCVEDDCDDGRADANPGAGERCGNAADDDCDGEADEGCGTCTDADGDGFCSWDDCRDDDAAANPDAFEQCGNRVDDDCDGQADEGCPVCVDADGDGACEGADCDDGDPAVRPGVEEACNGFDDDCDGRVDESCQGCTDEDADGACAEDDCDDQDPAIFPGNGEVPANGRDDDCDGQVDEGGPGGGCTAGAVPSSGAGPLAAWGLALLGLALRRRRA